MARPKKAPTETLTLKIDAAAAMDAINTMIDALPAAQLMPMPKLFIRRNSGDVFYYNDMSLNTFSLHDTAWSLSRINRFLGSTQGRPYSVAQHSCLVSDYMLKHYDILSAFIGLLHDAHESVLGDIPTPLKKAFLNSGLDLKRIFEEPIDDFIYDAIGIKLPLPAHVHENVKVADAVLYQAEGRMLMRNFVSAPIPEGAAAYENTITPWTADESYRQFISRFNKLKPLAQSQWR